MGEQRHTPGPWQWMSPHGRGWMLATPHSGQLFVMDFVRRGMQGAQPRFSDRNGERRGGVMHNADTLDVPNHPDARLMEAAPDLLEALEKVVAVADRRTAEFDDARAAIAKARGDQPEAAESEA